MALQNFLLPKFKVPSDIKNIMLEKADLRRNTKTKALWVIGFMHESEMAKIHKCYLEKFWWLICDKTGKVLDKYEGFYMDLPDKFKKFFKSTTSRLKA